MTLNTATIGLLAAMVAAFGLALLKWPELGTLTTTALLYLNFLTIATRVYGVPPALAGGIAILAVPPLVNHLVLRRERIIIDKPFLLMLLFLGCVLISSCYAKVQGLAIIWIVRYIGEGLLVYLLFINLIRSVDALRRITWVLVLCGGLLGSLTVYQEVTGSYRQEFGGLAGRNLEMEIDGGGSVSSRPKDGASIRLANRAQGPIDDPNRYAQMLLIVLPFGWCLTRTGSSPTTRSLAAAGSAMVVAGVLLTYSRGGFVGLMLLVAMLGALRMVPLRSIAVAIAAFGLTVSVMNPGYVRRMETLFGIGGLFSPTADAAPDAVERGRATHMLAAWHVFLDHPIVGTGPGQFAGVYSVDYSNELYSVRRVTEPRRAHSLYLELAAETGVVGFAVFMAIIVMVVRRLIVAWRRTAAADPFLRAMPAACLVGVTVYLTTAVFLQLSYQRYYWLLLALAGATVHLAEKHWVEGLRSATATNRAQD